MTRDEAKAFRQQANELMTAVMTFAEAMDVKAGIAPPPLKAVERREA